jgi:hypothetical protein
MLMCFEKFFFFFFFWFENFFVFMLFDNIFVLRRENTKQKTNQPAIQPGKVLKKFTFEHSWKINYHKTE